MARGLGKGLEGLFEDNMRFDDAGSENGLRTVRLSAVEPNRDQPRKAFDQEKIAELAASIRENGVLQPLIVQETVPGRYRIISGERRWRASREAGLEEIPVIVRELSEQQIMEVALIENLQREDLNPVEEARGYKALMDEFGLTQEQVAERVSKSRPAVANTMRLLGLPDEVLDMVLDGSLSAGHARALLPLMDTMSAKDVIAAAKKAVQLGLNVRAVESMVANMNKPKPEKKTVSPEVSAAYRKAEQSLSRRFGRKVNISYELTQDGKMRGTVTFAYKDAADLNELLDQLNDKEVE